MMSFGDRLRQIRKKSGLRQSEFAKSLHVTSAYVSKLELGKSNPSDMLIQTVCLIWGINEKWLRNGEGEMVNNANASNAKATGKKASRDEFIKYDLHEAQYQQLEELFSPAFPRLNDMIATLSDKEAYDFLMALNTLLHVWTARKDLRLRLQFKLEDLIPNYEIEKSLILMAAKRNQLLDPINSLLMDNLFSISSSTKDRNTDVTNDGIILSGDFIVIAADDSMIEAGIKKGDHCVIHPQEIVEDGEVALIAVGDSNIIRRFYRDTKGFRLMPCNGAYAQLDYNFSDNIRIIGKFVKVI